MTVQIPEDVKKKIEEILESKIKVDPQYAGSISRLKTFKVWEWYIESAYEFSQQQLEEKDKEISNLKRKVSDLKQQMFSLKYSIKAGRYRR